MIILGIILLLLGFIMSIVLILKDSVNGSAIVCAYFTGAIVIVGIMLTCKSSCPQAIDVYRGKTTLQITYKDNIPTDTIVVFK